jgi:hypothetical protein
MFRLVSSSTVCGPYRTVNSFALITETGSAMGRLLHDTGHLTTPIPPMGAQITEE